MSLKSRTAQPRSPPRRTRLPKPRQRVLPLLIASNVVARAPLFDTVNRKTLAGRAQGFRTLWRCSRLGIQNQTAAAPATDLTALAAGIAGFVCSPFVGSPLFVGGASAYAGDLALLFGRHRRKSPTFLAFSN